MNKDDIEQDEFVEEPQGLYHEGIFDEEIDENYALRVLEAALFASQEPLSFQELRSLLPEKMPFDLKVLLRKLQALYEGRGVILRETGGKWAYRTAPDLGYLMMRYKQETRKLSRTAVETLGIIAYHQPVTRVEIENIRGVGVSKGTLDILMDIGWVRLGKRRETPGRPVTFITTDRFLDHFGLAAVKDLPGLKELKEAGFLDKSLEGITMPSMDKNTEHHDDDESENANEREAKAAIKQDDLFGVF